MIILNTFKFRNLHQKNYFEGWYFRFTDEATNKNYAIITAITYNEQHPHAFIQSFTDHTIKNQYYTFKTDDFTYNDYSIQIQRNTLSKEYINYTLDDISINLDFTDVTTLEDIDGPSSAMGYLSKYPLECFQEVVILDGYATGTIDNKPVKGKIYMEKTYGRKFPSKWIWIQSNHHLDNDALSFSVGKIPMFGFKVRGFLCILKTQQKTYRLSTYNFARISVDNNVITLKKSGYKIMLKPQLKETCMLVGPSKLAKMDLDVFESINSSVIVEIYKRNKMIYSSTFTNAGIELMY